MELSGKYVKGKGVATDTVGQQKPLFTGFDFSGMHEGTINVRLESRVFLTPPREGVFHEQPWGRCSIDNFYIVPCVLKACGGEYQGYIYAAASSPHMGTSIIELIMPEVKGLKHGDKVSVIVADSDIFVQRFKLPFFKYFIK